MGGFTETGKVDDSTDKEKSIREELKEHKGRIWVDSLWTTYQESIDFEIPNPVNPESPIRISRKISKGMSVKTDSRTPARIMNEALKQTLNPMLEEDKEAWLNTQKMRRELVNTGRALTKAINDMVESIEGDEVGKHEEPASGSDENPSNNDGAPDPENTEGERLF
jgi:hypothetical protein